MAKRNASDASLSPDITECKAGKMQSVDLHDNPFKEEIRDVREQIKKDISTVSQKLGDLYGMQSEAIEAIQFQGGFVENVSNRLLNLERSEKEKNRKINDLECELISTRDELGKVKLEARENTIERRSANMVVNGLRETKDEVPISVAFNFVLKLIPDFNQGLIVDAYRLGKAIKDGEVNRALFIKFRDANIKMQVMKKKGALYKNKALKMGSVYCNDDLTEDSRLKRQEMREIARHAKGMGYRDAKVVGNKLMVNGTPYLEDELHLLPTELLLANIRTRKVRNGIGFCSKESYLSNFYATRVVINGETFSSSEQAYQFSKAIICEREDIAKFIKQCNDPVKIKHQGDRVEVKKKWENQKLNVMKCIVTGKFLQNQEIRDKLINTGSSELYECTTNTFWGTGWRIDSPQWITTANFPGDNQLGKILMEVRDLINGGITEPINHTPRTRISEHNNTLKNLREEDIDLQGVGAIGGATISGGSDATATTMRDQPLTSEAMETQEAVTGGEVGRAEGEKCLSGNATNSESSSVPEADSEVVGESSCISVDSDLFSRSSFSVKSVLNEDGHLNHSKMLEWALPAIDTSRLRALAASNFPAVAGRGLSKTATSIPCTSTPVLHVAARKSRKKKKTENTDTDPGDRWNLSKMLERYRSGGKANDEGVK